MSLRCLVPLCLETPTSQLCTVTSPTGKFCPLQSFKMRYLNWDVLLFPAGSKVPIQEFKTGCYAVQDPEFLGADPLAGTSCTPPSVDALNLRELTLCLAATFAFDHVPTPQVPIVACFIANLPDGSPFRVSLHSWERPSPSQSLQNPLQHGKSLCFEARVFIDGVCVS